MGTIVFNEQAVTDRIKRNADALIVRIKTNAGNGIRQFNADIFVGTRDEIHEIEKIIDTTGAIMAATHKFQGMTSDDLKIYNIGISMYNL